MTRGALLLVLVAALSGCQAPAPGALTDPGPQVEVSRVEEEAAPLESGLPEFPQALLLLKHRLHEARGLLREHERANLRFADGLVQEADYRRAIAEARDAIRRARAEVDAVSGEPELAAAVDLYLDAVDRRLAAREACAGRESCDGGEVALAAREVEARALLDARLGGYALRPSEAEAAWRLRVDALRLNDRFALARAEWTLADTWRNPARIDERLLGSISAFEASVRDVEARHRGAELLPATILDAETSWSRWLGEAREWTREARRCIDEASASPPGWAACHRANFTADGPRGEGTLRILDEYGPRPLDPAETEHLRALLARYLELERRYLDETAPAFARWKAGAAAEADARAAIERFASLVAESEANATRYRPPESLAAVGADWSVYLSRGASWAAAAELCVHNDQIACPSAAAVGERFESAATRLLNPYFAPFFETAEFRRT